MTHAPGSIHIWHRSPPLGVVAIVFLLLFAASLASFAMLTRGAPYPTPYWTITDLQDHYTRFSDAVMVSAFWQYGACIPFGVLAVSLVSRLRFYGVNVAGVYIALFGGVGAALFLGISALATWVLSQPGVAVDPGALRAIQLFGFATGGVGHTTMLALLLAGVALPILAFDLAPRWIAISGILCACLAMLSVLSLVNPSFSVLLPIGRFPAYVWLIAAGFALPKGLPAARAKTTRERPAAAGPRRPVLG